MTNKEKIFELVGDHREVRWEQMQCEKLPESFAYMLMSLTEHTDISYDACYGLMSEICDNIASAHVDDYVKNESLTGTFEDFVTVTNELNKHHMAFYACRTLLRAYAKCEMINVNEGKIKVTDYKALHVVLDNIINGLSLLEDEARLTQ